MAIQLLEVAVLLIKRIRKYAEENNLVLSENHALNRLPKEAETILNEANYVDKKLKSRKLVSDRILQHDKSDEDMPVSVCLMYL